MRGEEDPDLRVRWEWFRAKMRQRRLELGMTQTELGEAMGAGQDYVCKLESADRSIPNLVTIWRWTDALSGSVGVRWGEGALRE